MKRKFSCQDAQNLVAVPESAESGQISIRLFMRGTKENGVNDMKLNYSSKICPCCGEPIMVGQEACLNCHVYLWEG